MRITPFSARASSALRWARRSKVVFVPLVTDSIAERRESFVVNLRADQLQVRQLPAQLEVVVLDDDSR